MDDVWVFNGETNRFPSGVFGTRESAEAWIRQHALTGTLTNYPVGQAIYDWAVASGTFQPKVQQHSNPAFIANFSSALQEHYHFENGE